MKNHGVPSWTGLMRTERVVNQMNSCAHGDELCIWCSKPLLIVTQCMKVRPKLGTQPHEIAVSGSATVLVQERVWKVKSVVYIYR